MKVNYGFTVYDDDDPESILHMVVFEKKPSVRDWNHIMEELEIDPEFQYLNDYRWTMRYSTEEEVNNIREQFETHIAENPNSELAKELRSDH